MCYIFSIKNFNSVFKKTIFFKIKKRIKNSNFKDFFYILKTKKKCITKIIFIKTDAL